MKAVSETKRTLLFVYIAYFLTGMLSLSTGSLLPFIRESRNLDYAQAGLIVSFHAAGKFFSSFSFGFLDSAIGRKRTILIFEIFFPIAFILIYFGNGFAVIAAAYLMTGMARGANTNYCNAAVNELAPGEASLLNGLHAVFSIGAFVFPLLVAAIKARSAGNWSYACLLMAGMGVVCLLLYIFCPEDEKKNGRSSRPAFLESTIRLFSDRTFRITLVVLFFYLCAEASITGWMVTYFTDTGYISAELSQLTASALWIMMMSGRFLTAFLSRKIDKRKLLTIMGLGMVFFFILLLFAHNAAFILFCIMGLGFFMAGISPTSFSFAGGISDHNPLAWSFLLTAGSLGAMIMPVIVGNISERAGIVPGISSIAVVVVIDFFCILLLCSRKEKK